jgi:hypothetical protein
MALRRQLPDVPRFEDPQFDADRDLANLDGGTRAFVLEMREAGGARLDLGDAARRLCDQAVAETEPFFAQGRRVQDAWRAAPAVRKLAVLPRIHEALFAAYGRRSFPFQTLNFREGSQQELHSDVIHFSSVPPRFMCGVWIALEDVTPGSGPLTYHPGSHRLDEFTMRRAGVNTDKPGYDDYVHTWAPRFAQEVERSGYRGKDLLMPKGHAFVWAANLAHGGAPITVPGSTRRSLVVHCYFEDSVYFTPMTSDVEGGRLSVRLPPDIRTGGFRVPRQNGRVVMPPLKSIAGALLRQLTGKPAIT